MTVKLPPIPSPTTTPAPPRVSMAGRGVREAELALELARVDVGEAAKAFGRAHSEVE